MGYCMAGTSCKAIAAEDLYAFINPGTPNNVPPKYLTTTINTLVNCLLSMALSIGLPAEPLGSLSSLTLKLFPSVPIL